MHLTNRAEVSTSTSLIRKALLQEPEAWSSLLDQYGPLAYNHARYLGLTPEEAADVTQETLAAIYLNLDRFKRESDLDGFRKWIRGIVRHKAYDVIRDAAKRLDVAIGGSDFRQMLAQSPMDSARSQLSSLGASGPNRQVESSGLSYSVASLRRILTLIRSDFATLTWQAFWETAINGRNATQVAAELEMTSAAVRKAKSRVINRLKEEFNRQASSEPA